MYGLDSSYSCNDLIFICSKPLICEINITGINICDVFKLNCINWIGWIIPLSFILFFMSIFLLVHLFDFYGMELVPCFCISVIYLFLSLFTPLLLSPFIRLPFKNLLIKVLNIPIYSSSHSILVCIFIIGNT